MASTGATPAPSTGDGKPAKVDLGLLEEDDEFEEFPADGKFLIGVLISGLISVIDHCKVKCVPGTKY